jgi:hypothetical protein
MGETEALSGWGSEVTLAGGENAVDRGSPGMDVDKERLVRFTVGDLLEVLALCECWEREEDAACSRTASIDRGFNDREDNAEEEWDWGGLGNTVGGGGTATLVSIRRMGSDGCDVGTKRGGPRTTPSWAKGENPGPFKSAFVGSPSTSGLSAFAGDRGGLGIGSSSHNREEIERRRGAADIDEDKPCYTLSGASHDALSWINDAPYVRLMDQSTRTS